MVHSIQLLHFVPKAIRGLTSQVRKHNNELKADKSYTESALLLGLVFIITASITASSAYFQMSSDCSKQQLYVKLLETEKKLDQLLKNESIKPIQVELLHQYNDIKDATQVVIGHLANIEGTSVSEIHKRMNLFD